MSERQKAIDSYDNCNQDTPHSLSFSDGWDAAMNSDAVVTVVHYARKLSHRGKDRDEILNAIKEIEGGK